MANFQSRRLEFHTKLETLLGSSNVYFQPPPNLQMKYPCVVYELDNASLKSADNMAYTWTPRYQVTSIDHDPDSDVIAKLAKFPLSAFSRRFSTTGLNHVVFVIYH